MSPPIDSGLIPYQKISFDSKVGPLANPQATGFAWPLFIVSIVCICTLKPFSVVLGIFLFLVSSLIIFSYRGVEFDLEKDLYREYTRWFGLFKTGDYHNTEIFPFVSVLSKQLANELRLGITLRYRDHGVYLLSNDHRLRIQIASADDEASALAAANAIAKKTNKQYMIYNPPQRAGRSSRRKR